VSDIEVTLSCRRHKLESHGYVSLTLYPWENKEAGGVISRVDGDIWIFVTFVFSHYLRYIRVLRIEGFILLLKGIFVILVGW